MADEAARFFVAIYTDADIHGGLAAQIRRHGFDAMSAYETGNAELNDNEQLAYAASQERTILTCNNKDFEPVYEEWCGQSVSIPASSFRSNCRSVRCCGESCDF